MPLRCRVPRGDGLEGEFWDDRARDDAFYFVENPPEYGKPDIERFWREGEADLDRLLDATGARLVSTDRVAEIGCGLGRLTRTIGARPSLIARHAVCVPGPEGCLAAVPRR